MIKYLLFSTLMSNPMDTVPSKDFAVMDSILVARIHEQNLKIKKIKAEIDSINKSIDSIRPNIKIYELKTYELGKNK